MRNMFNLIISICLILSVAHADTPPNGAVKAWVFDSGGNTIGSTTSGLDVYCLNCSGGGGTVNQGAGGVSPWAVQFLTPQAVTGTFFQSVQPVSQSGTFSVLSSQEGTWNVGITGGTLTANIGTTGGLALDATLSALSAKFNSLGQKTSANSAPVVIASDQSAIPVTGTITTSPNVNVHDGSGTAINSTSNALNSYITNSSLAVTGTFFQATQPVSGNLGRTWDLSSGTDSVSSVESGTWNVGLNAGSNNIGSITNITGTVSLPTGAATNSELVTINSTLGSPFQAGGSIGNTTFGSTQSGAWNLNNITGTISLPTGAATSANQTTANSTLSNIQANQTNGTQITQVSSTVAAPDFTASGSLTAACVTPTSCGAGSTVTLASVSALGNAILELQGTWAGTVIVEGSNDSGATWNSRSIIQTAPTQLSNTGVSANGYYRITGVGAYKQLRARMTVFTSGSATTVLNASIGTDVVGVVNTNPNNLIMSESATNAISTYGACVIGVTPATTPTDIVTLTGSATKVVTLTDMDISGTETTVLMRNFLLVLRSTADSGGTSATMAAVPHDPNDAAATATALSYTANPTLGSTIGTVWNRQFVIPATTGADSTWPQTFNFGNHGQGIVLRGTSSQAAINLNGVPFTAGSMNFCIRWTEQ